jgi:hypothetical protein
MMEPADFTDIDFSNPGNWIALARDVLSHPVVGAGQQVKPCDPKRAAYSRCEAWIDLLCLAQYKPARYNNKGEIITLLVGQLMGARAYLSARWNWTEETVRWYLKNLEAHGMIARTANQTENHNQRTPSKRGNQCNVITISNYGKYQIISDAVENYLLKLKQPANPQRTTSQPPESNKETNKQSRLPPTPLEGEGGALAAVQTTKKSKFKAEDIRISDEALQLYNATAKRLGFATVASFTEARRTRLLKRLADISGLGQGSGLEAFRTALSAIEHVPFLMGKTPPRPGEAPFKLDFERLLQSSGDKLGDVLAKLIDKAVAVAAAGGCASDPPPRNGKTWGWWRDIEGKLKAMSVDSWRSIDKEAKPNGTWPWDVMGPPPGHPECLLPKELLAEKGYAEIYKGNIQHP